MIPPLSQFSHDYQRIRLINSTFPSHNIIASKKKTLNAAEMPRRICSVVVIWLLIFVLIITATSVELSEFHNTKYVAFADRGYPQGRIKERGSPCINLLGS